MTMMTHLNKFIANATLAQFYIVVSDKLITGNFVVGIEDYEINVLYNINRDYNSISYNNFINVVPSLIPAESSCIEINGEKIFVKGNKELFSTLLLAGNVKQKDSKICFYGKVLEIIKTNKRNYIKVELSGVWIDGNKFLNIHNDIPYMFSVESVKFYNNKNVQILELEYNSGFTNKDDVVEYHSDPQLMVEKSIDTQEQIDQSLLKDLMTEWEIRNAK